MTKNSFLFVSILLFAAGCGSGNVGLSGKVYFSDDNSPVTNGTVCFETDTYLARATIKPDGTYVTGSVQQTDGLPPGTYRVYISGANKVSGQDKDGNDIYEPLIDEKFADGTSSGITIEATSTKKGFDISVDRYVPPKKK